MHNISFFKNGGDIIEKVETFIQHYRALDYIIDEKGNSIRCFKWGIPFKLSYLLACSITNYELVKENTVFKITTGKEKLESAIDCLKWIDKAIAYGIVKEGQGLVSKFKECSEENISLRKELETASDSLMRAKERIEELECIIPNAGSEHA